MKKFLFRVLFVLLVPVISLPAHSCMNEWEETDAIVKPDPEEIGAIMVYVNSEKLREELQKLSCFFEEEKNLTKECSDAIVWLIYLREYKDALTKSEILVKKFPSVYNVVITHAVALELNGKYEEALTFLKKAVKIDPKSHNGSEWIHVKILEYVVKYGVDASPDATRSVLNLDFGNDSIPVAPKNSDTRKLMAQLQYQLSDRAYFVEKNDPVYGSLMFDYANCLVLNDYLTLSVEYFEKAKNYGFSSDVLDKRLKRYGDRKRKKEERRNPKPVKKKKRKASVKKKTDSKTFSGKSILFIVLLSGILTGLMIWLLEKSKKK